MSIELGNKSDQLLIEIHKLELKIRNIYKFDTKDMKAYLLKKSKEDLKIILSILTGKLKEIVVEMIKN